MKKFLPYIACFVAGVFACFASCMFYKKHKAYKSAKFEFVEIVSYKTKQGVDEKAHDDIIYKVNKELKKFPGFVARTLSKTDGAYYDIVFWKTKDSYEQSMQDIQQIEVAKQYFDMIDQSSIVLHNGSLVNFYYPSLFKKDKKNKDGNNKYHFPSEDKEIYKSYKKYKKCIKKDEEDEDECREHKKGYEEFIAKHGDVFEMDKNHHEKDHHEKGNHAKSSHAKGEKDND